MLLLLNDHRIDACAEDIITCRWMGAFATEFVHQRPYVAQKPNIYLCVVHFIVRQPLKCKFSIRYGQYHGLKAIAQHFRFLHLAFSTYGTDGGSLSPGYTWSFQFAQGRSILAASFPVP